MTPQTFIFIGRSGCGKGTQADLLQKVLKEKDPGGEIFYLETGARFRDFIEKDNYSSKLAKRVYVDGDRQPDFLAIWMWSHLLIESFKGTEHLFVDGTPRSLPEALSFTTAVNFYRRHTPNIMHINVSREWSEERLLSRGRFDDVDKEKVKKRLDWFDADVHPAVEYFRTSNVYNFVEVNGEQAVEKVHADILEKLGWQ